MKHIIILLMFLSQIYSSIAQITITSNDIANIGVSLPRIVDTNPSASITPGGAGENLIWDFSSISANINDTIKFVEVDNTPYASEFTDADLCIMLGTDIDYAYASYSSSAIKIQGASQYIDELEDDVVVHFDPEQTNMMFPSTYESSFTDNYGFSVVRYYGETVTLPGIPYPVMVDSVKIISSTEATNSFDAWGELITPYGDFSTIRNWRVDYVENELYAKSNLLGFWIDVTSWIGDASTDTVSIYSWWAKDVGYPVFEIETDYNSGEVKRASCLEVEDISVNQKESTKFSSSVYPIPANNNLNIKTNYKGKSIINIYDMTGSLVISETINNSVKSINVSNLSESLYFYTLTSSDKKEIGQGKFYIVR